MRSIRALLPQMLLLVPGTFHQVYKPKRIHYGELRDTDMDYFIASKC